MAQEGSPGEHPGPTVTTKGQGDWKESRWFRIRQPDSSLWMETSNYVEALEESRRMNWPIETLYKREEWEWRVD